jgi:hypothetical protein
LLDAIAPLSEDTIIVSLNKDVPTRRPMVFHSASGSYQAVVMPMRREVVDA